MPRAVTIGCATFLGCLAFAAPAAGLGEPSLVRDIRPGPDDGGVFSLAPFDGRLYFSADDGANGSELWSSDGTTAGTSLFKDIVPGSGSSSPIGMTDAFGELIFRASHPDHGAEPWASDGTSAGTALVTDVAPGPDTSGPFSLALGASRAFFQADDGTTGNELYVYGGPGTDTTLVEDLSPGGDSGVQGGMLAVDDTVYFGGDDGTGLRLWKSNGTAASTEPVSSAVFLDLTPHVWADGKLFFSAVTGAAGYEPWVYDSAEGTTTMLKDIVPGPTWGLPLFVSAATVDETVLFTAGEGPATELWKTDGTPDGTVRVEDGVRTIGTLVVADGVAYFAGGDGGGAGTELWRSDGTVAGTRIVADIDEGMDSSLPEQLTAIGGRLFFSASDGVSGSELWTSDGTEAGTRMVADVVNGPDGSLPGDITEAGGNVFFVADTPAWGRELWGFELDVSPVAVGDSATLAEDAAATAIPVLANDSDVDGGAPKSVASVTQPANGEVVVTGGGSGLTYEPDPDYCNDGAPTDDFTYVLSPGGDTATVAMAVVCVADPQPPRNDPPPPGNTPPPGDPPPPTVPAPDDPVGTAAAGRVATVRDGVARLRFRCRGGGACKGRATLAVTVRRGKRTVRVALGARRFAIPAGKSMTLRVRLNRTGRSRLAKAPSGRLRVKLAGRGVEPSTVVLKAG